MNRNNAPTRPAASSVWKVWIEVERIETEEESGYVHYEPDPMPEEAGVFDTLEQAHAYRLQLLGKEPESQVESHTCMDHACQVFTDGPLGHGWECSRCGRFLQAG